MRLRDKRGMTLGDIYPAVLTIVLVGLILGIGIYVMSEVRENVYDANTLVTVSEETTLINESNNNIADTIGERDWASPTLTGIWNATQSYAVGNATLNATGHFHNASTIQFEDAGVRVNYTYTWSADNEASNSLNTTIGGVADFAGWIAVIVVVIAAAIVLGIVLNSFGRRTPGV